MRHAAFARTLSVVLLLVALPATAAVTISGTIQRTYPYSACGQASGCKCTTTTQTAPVRHAKIEVRSTANVTLLTGGTSRTGTFSFNVGSLNPGSGFRLIVWPETEAAKIYHLPTNTMVGVQYGWTTSTATTSVGTLTINADTEASAPHIRGALHIMDEVIRAYEYAANRGLWMNQAEVFMNADRTYYDSRYNNIYLHADETWGDATIHEYGHYVDDAMSPYRAAHGLSNHEICGVYDSDPAGAFGEDWASYLISAVTGHLWFSRRWCSIESGPCGTKSPNIEGNAAAVLWDLHDSANESFDTVSGESQKVWDVMEGFQFSDPTLATYMTDYGDARADAIECRYTGAKCASDTTKPVATAFNVTPTSVRTGSAVTANYTVSDSGSGLARVELWRAPDSGGSPGAWAQVTSRSASGNGPSSGSLSDIPPSAGTFWYGLHVVDQAGNLGLEPSPPGAIRVIVSTQCSYAVTPASRSASGASGSGYVEVTGSPSSCSGSWSASTTASFLTLYGTKSGSGSGYWQVPYSHSENSGSARQATVSFSGQFPSGSTFRLNQDAIPIQNCTYGISPQAASGAGGGGTGSIQVSGSPSGCSGSWSAAANAFLTLTGTQSGSGSGSWSVGYSYSQNPSTSSSRQGAVGFDGAFPGGSTFTVTQSPATAPACSFSIAPSSASGNASGGSGAIQVSASPSGCTGSWSAATASFITLTGTQSGSGGGSWSVPYSYTANPSTASARQGAVSFSGAFPNGATFTLTQPPSAAATCSYSISPTSASGGGTGGTGSVQVLGSPGGCAGSWSAVSGASYLMLTGTQSGSGAGSWTIPYSYQPNPSATSSRQGTISFGGSFAGTSTFTLTQSASQAPSCSYAISPTSAAGNGTGGTGAIQVTGSPSNCSGSWSAASGAAFLALTGTQSGSGAGSWSVAYSYGGNGSTSSSRQGTVVFSGAFSSGGTFVLTQNPAPAGACTYSINPTSASGSAGAGSGSIQVSGSPAGCSGSWSAASGASFLTLTGTAAGSGAGVWNVPYSFSANSAANQRQGTIGFSGAFGFGTFTFVQSGSGTAADLVPYKPDGWADRMVLSKTTGTHTDDTAFSSTDVIYLDWAVINSGGPAGPFLIDLHVDGIFHGSWYSDTTLEQNWWLAVHDLPIGPLADGAHTVTLRADSGRDVTESSEANNQYTKTFRVGSRRGVSGGDFNGDGRTELLWKHSTTGVYSMWELNGRQLVNGSRIVTVPDVRWKTLGFGDFNKDGYDDVFLRHSQSGQTAVWLLKGRTFVASAFSAAVPDLRWQMQAIGDFNGDGRDELIWRNTSTGAVSMWEMNGASVVNGSVIRSVPDSNWQIQLAGDFDADGIDELLWRNTATGALSMWDLNGRTILDARQFATVPDSGWQIVSVGDYNGDRKADLLWRHAQTGRVSMWEMNHRTILNGAAMSVGSDASWIVERSGDFNGDGRDEIVWRNSRTGSVSMWEVNGHTLLNGGAFQTVADLNWRIQPRGGIRPSLSAQ